jgi:hypothetical protein
MGGRKGERIFSQNSMKPMGRLLLLALAITAALFGSDANAQLSPNCERNGKRDYCAITPVAGATNVKQTFDMIMFADGTVYEVLRSERSCKKVAQNIETCNAKIITPPGNPRSIPAFYRRTFYEGGVKQEYVGKGIHIVYLFID